MRINAGTKHRRFGFPDGPSLSDSDTIAARAPARTLPNTTNDRIRCVESWEYYERDQDPLCGTRARGDVELSASKRSKTEGAGKSERSNKSKASDRNAGKQRSSDLGRALRSTYDDTLREPVPDDFLDLLGKLD